jgi:CRP/FNR family cyclic AMP-dependent transcriptional regulator
VISIAERLKETPLFRGINLTDLQALVALMKLASYPAETVLFRRGDEGNAMYIILAGQLRVYVEDAQGRPLTLAHYEPLKIVGEFSLLDSQPRSASGVVIEPLEVLILQRDDFLAFVATCPSLGLAMIRNLSERIRQIVQYLKKVNSFLQRLSEGDYEQAVREILISSDDSDIQGMIATYLAMVRSIQRREDDLKNKLPTTQQ